MKTNKQYPINRVNIYDDGIPLYSEKHKYVGWSNQIPFRWFKQLYHWFVPLKFNEDNLEKNSLTK